MRILLILVSAVTIVHAKALDKKECDGVIINNVYYDKELLKTDLDRPYMLTVDYNTNTVYFSYSLDKTIFKSAYVNLNTKEYCEVDDVNNGFAQTVDQKNHVIYIGGGDGIYTYDYKAKKSEHFGAKNVSIWYIYFKDKLYYSDYPGRCLYTLVNGESTKFKGLEDTKVEQFVIDYEGDMFFSNSSGLYMQKKGAKGAILFKEIIGGVRGLTTDINGNVFFIISDGIYRVSKCDVCHEKILDVYKGFGMAFDNENNIVYSDVSSLYHLKRNKSKNCKS